MLAMRSPRVLCVRVCAEMGGTLTLGGPSVAAAGLVRVLFSGLNLGHEPPHHDLIERARGLEGSCGCTKWSALDMTVSIYR